MPRTLVHSPLPIAEGHQETHCGNRRLQVVLGEVGGTEHGAWFAVRSHIRFEFKVLTTVLIRSEPATTTPATVMGVRSRRASLGRPRRRRTRMTTTASVGMKKNSQVLMEPKTEPTQSTAKTCSGS